MSQCNQVCRHSPQDPPCSISPSPIPHIPHSSDWVGWPLVTHPATCRVETVTNLGSISEYLYQFENHLWCDVYVIIPTLKRPNIRDCLQFINFPWQSNCAPDQSDKVHSAGRCIHLLLPILHYNGKYNVHRYVETYFCYFVNSISSSSTDLFIKISWALSIDM